jgi:hypothetical protein
MLRFITLERNDNRMQRSLITRLSILLLACGLLFSACDIGGTVTVTSTGGSTTTSSTTTGSTTTTTATTCASVMPSGTIPNGTPTITAFADVALPASSFAAPTAIHLNGGTNLYTVYLDQICTQGTSVSAIQTFFASGLPAAGWPYAPKLPFDGGYFAPCGDPYCWAQNANARMVGLEAVTDRGNSVVTYTLRLFSEPPAPTCASQFNTPPFNVVQTFQEVFENAYYISLPPQARTVPDDASGGQKGVDICSAGTVASIIAYMQTELPKQGFSLVSGSGGNQTWQNAGHQVTWMVSDPLSWVIYWREPLP